MTTVTYIGGPTALVAYGGLRLLTDPTLDAAPADYAYLHKTGGPALEASEIGLVDAVLLSHDHHADNLDEAGRAVAQAAPRVLTTHDGAGRLGGNATGLGPWETAQLGAVRVTATPARHGPEGGDRGPVVGFVLEADGEPALWFSGDTVLFDGAREVAERFDIGIALLNIGAARVAAAGDHHLTLTGAEAAQLALAMPSALIVPLHFEGWQHFSEGRAEAEAAFAQAGVEARVRWPVAGEPLELT